jgi:hypothetical protein
MKNNVQFTQGRLIEGRTEQKTIAQKEIVYVLSHPQPKMSTSGVCVAALASLAGLGGVGFFLHWLIPIAVAALTTMFVSLLLIGGAVIVAVGFFVVLIAFIER